MGRDSDPIEQRIHRENAERMYLASFIGGLHGIVSRQTRFANPQSLQQALTTALAVTEAMRQEKASEIFFARNSDQKGHGSKA
jgi:hypothetical protein